MPAHSLFLAKLKSDDRRELEQRLWSRQSGVCFICDDPIDLKLHSDTLEIDHIVPIAVGGKDEENNFALTHEQCNRRKSSSDLNVARVLAAFSKIESQADSETAGRGANLGHVLLAYGGAKLPLRLAIEKETVRLAIPNASGNPIVSVPLWQDPLSLMRYCYLKLPITHLHHDTQINPRSIGVNIRGLIEEFYKKRPQLHVALAWWGPDSGEEGPVQIFDGQHKAAAQILLGVKELPVRIFIRPNRDVLTQANTNAGDKLRQVAFSSDVKRHLGNTLYKERVEEYQRLRQLSPEDFSFSEGDMVRLFRGEHRQLTRYIIDSVRDGITRDPNNKLMDFVEWSGKGAERPLAYATVEKTFYSEFLYAKPMETPLSAGQETGTNPRGIEREQMVRLMSLFADAFFVGQWNPELTGQKLEDKVLKGEPIPSGHLRAWRISRDEVLANILDLVRSAITYYFAVNHELFDGERVMQVRFPEKLWATIETVLSNVADLPCWVDKKLAQTIFGVKQKRDFWKEIFRTGNSPTQIPVLTKGLDFKSLVTPKGAA